MCEKAEGEAIETIKLGVTLRSLVGNRQGINIERMERWQKGGGEKMMQCRDSYTNFIRLIS